MATVNMTNKRKHAEKKTKSVASPNVLPVDDGVVGLDILQLANIPSDAIVTDAYLVVNVATQAAVTAELGFDGDSSLGTALVVSATGIKVGLLVDNTDKVSTGTGKVLTLIFSATPTSGDIDVVVEYTEPKLGNGMLTKVINVPA